MSKCVCVFSSFWDFPDALRQKLKTEVKTEPKTEIPIRGTALARKLIAQVEKMLRI